MHSQLALSKQALATIALATIALATVQGSVHAGALLRQVLLTSRHVVLVQHSNGLGPADLYNTDLLRSTK